MHFYSTNYKVWTQQLKDEQIAIVIINKMGCVTFVQKYNSTFRLIIPVLHSSDVCNICLQRTIVCGHFYKYKTVAVQQHMYHAKQFFCNFTELGIKPSEDPKVSSLTNSKLNQSLKYQVGRSKKSVSCGCMLSGSVKRVLLHYRYLNYPLFCVEAELFGNDNIVLQGLLTKCKCSLCNGKGCAAFHFVTA